MIIAMKSVFFLFVGLPLKHIKLLLYNVIGLQASLSFYHFIIRYLQISNNNNNNNNNG